jgi:nicotinamide-nucleotide amidase
VISPLHLNTLDLKNSPVNNASLNQLAADLGTILKDKCWVLALAESCTGGMVAQTVTNIAGSSAWFDRAFITYSNQAKIEMLNVLETTLEAQGAVSEQVAAEMALGAFKKSDASIAVSITGIAGPDGGSADKPVGTVCFGFAFDDQVIVTTQHFSGDRAKIRALSAQYALNCLIELVPKL